MAAPEKKAPRPKLPDFGAIQMSKFDASKETPSVKSVEKTPLLAMYKESFDSIDSDGVAHVGHRFRVPTVNAKQTETLIRAAAQKYGGGANIGIRPLPGGESEVSFAAKRKKAFTKPRKPIAPKRKPGESASDWRARQDKFNTAMNAWRRANPDKA